MQISSGARLGPYEIVAPLGAGGMGHVYRARDTRLGREVAIKVLRGDFAPDPGRLRRFRGEARSASALSDPHIVTVFDVGEANGIHFFASELVEGSNLRQLMEAGPLPLEKALDFAEQVASGLAAAHEKGIVHRDVKPENILITRAGLAKIADFGVAKLVKSSSANPRQVPTSVRHQTSTGVILGTVAYMSPEQVRGHNVDHRSDIFSFGALLYEMLSGRKAFEGETAAETMALILRDEPQPLGDVAPAVPIEVRLIVERCLAKDPADRYDGTRDLARDLASSRAHPVGIEACSPASVRGARTWRFVAAGVVAFLGILGLLAALARQRSLLFREPTRFTRRDPPRIVVLPFENLGSSEEAYFAAGITEEITSRLANVRRLDVISRTTATQYPRRGKTVKQIGAELEVDWVLEGTVRCDRSARTGRVRITPQLIRVADDTHVWSERYDRTMTDIFSVQSDVATKTVEAIGISLIPSEKFNLAAIPTKDVIAYDHYLRGLTAERLSAEKNVIEEAVGHFQEAVNSDPSFVPALAHLSYQHLGMYWYFYDHSRERLGKAKAAAEAAINLGPGLPESHTALGWLRYQGFRDYSRAIQEFEAARRIRPNDDSATIGLAAVVRRLGRWEESAALFAEAARLDPRNTAVLTELGESLILSRRYSEADRAFATVASLSSEVEPRAFRTWLQVQWRGDLEGAEALLGSARVPGLRDEQGQLDLAAYRLSLAQRDLPRALARLNADSRKAYSSQFAFLPLDLLRSQVYGLMGRSEESRGAAEKARSLIEREIREAPDDARLQSALGTALALLGRDDEALRAARRGVELMPVSRDAWVGLRRIEDLAFVCTLTGRHDEAVEQLGALLSRSGEMTPHLLRVDPRWDALRTNPKFDALLAKYLSHA